MPLVSIIVPAYNAEAWIGEALRSVIAQTHGDWQCIVVDDGSKDGTAAAVEALPDDRIALISQANAGQSAAANRGLEEARGDYIKFLDADDSLNAEHLAAQLQALDGRQDAVADCAWGYFVADPETVTPRKESTNRDFDAPLEWLVASLTQNEGMMGGWKWLLPREVIERAGGWNPQLSLNNDFDFSIRQLLAARAVRWAPRAVYRYRKTLTPTLSGSKGRRAMESALLTTQLGCAALRRQEDSLRIRRICADRHQGWLYQFFPDFPDLAHAAEAAVAELGGSQRPLEGGRLLQRLLPILGWKNIRRLQTIAYRSGWAAVLKRKEKQRVECIEPTRPGG